MQAFGSRNAAGDPLTTDTVMYGASLTKAVVGYVAMQLAQEKKLKLDRSVAEILPKPLPEYENLPAYGHWGDLRDDPRWRALTPRMILNHSTGFANFAFLEPDKKIHIHFAPGTRYAYSGEGMMLLQFGLERGLGLDLETELKARFLKPLGMKRTSLIWRPEFKTKLRIASGVTGASSGRENRARCPSSLFVFGATRSRRAPITVAGRRKSRRSRGGNADRATHAFRDGPSADRPVAAGRRGLDKS